MSEQFMTVAQVIDKLDEYPESMKVKITYYSGVAHGIVLFNTIKISHEEEELQFAFDNQKPRFHHEEYALGVLLKQIKDLVERSQNQADVEKFLVCKREIGVISPGQVTEDTMYLKHIKPKSEFSINSGMVHDDGVEDTLFFEFIRRN